MSAPSRVRQLLARMLETGLSAEAVCADEPELLPEVQRCWQQLRELDLAAYDLLPGDGALAAPAPILPDIPGYTIEAVLGRGGMGIVYRARHLRLDRPVALKMLLGGAYADTTALERFHREAEMVAALRHPHIVQVFDFDEYEGWPYFTMEYVDGGTLAAQIAGRPQDARHAAQLTATLASAVHALHRCDVVHRDLKPGNILLTSDGVAKIGDFGLASRFGGGPGVTATGAMVGTPSYMAPEQAAGRTDAIGPATDVYALGAILYELLTGRPPFRSDSAAETQRRVLYEEPTPPSRWRRGMPRDLETICLECLRKEPARRYATAAALADDLERFLRHEPILARRIGRIGRTLRWTRRNPAGAALLLLTSVLLALGASWLVRGHVLAAERDALAEQWRPRLDRVAQVLRDGFDNEEAQELLKQMPAALPPDLQQRELGLQRELQLLTSLDEVRSARIAIRDGRMDFLANCQRAVVDYSRLFHDAGFDVGVSDPGAVASWMQGTNVHKHLVAALDDWALCTPDTSHRDWILRVARRADPDPTGWRDQVRDPSVFTTPARLQSLADEPSIARQSVKILVTLAERMHACGLNPLTFLRRVQQVYPGDFWVNFQLGDLLWQAEPDEGIRYFQAALAVRPQAALAHVTLGCALAKSKRIADARDSFLAATRIEPAYANAHSELGRAYFMLGDHDSAVAELKKAVSFEPTMPRHRLTLGAALLDRGSVDAAIAELQQAVCLAPDDPDSHRWLAQALAAANRNDEAATEVAAADLLGPNGPMVLLGQNRIDEAMAAANKALAAEPRSASRHCQLGDCLARLGRRDEAAARFRAALELEPGNVEAYQHLRGMLVVLGRHDEALALCEQAIAAHPEQQQAWDGYAEMCLYLGRPDDYRRICAQLLERFGSVTDPRECERTGRACLLLLQPGEVLAGATKLIDRALAADASTYPTWARPYFLFAKALADCRAGRCDDALVLLRGEAFVVLQPAPLLVQAMALQATGKGAVARRALATGALRFDWNPAHASDREAWLVHLCRREAEAMIAPELADWLAGRRQPVTDDERAILLAASRAADQVVVAARLYTELLDGKGAMAATAVTQRYPAACTALAASMAASGPGAPDDDARTRLRASARRWLSAELSERAAEYARVRPARRQQLVSDLRFWTYDPELAALREPTALQNLPDEEREECRQLWDRLRALLTPEAGQPARPAAPTQPADGR